MTRLAICVIAVAACSAPAAPPAIAREPVAAWQVRAAGGADPIDPGPAASALLDPVGCAGCHAAIVDEWATSRHALAWTNGIFQREYSARPQQWCVNCHAPLTTQQRDLAGPAAARGVDCATCHVRHGKLVSASKRARSPHDTIADPSFGSPAYCADCHQFTFPVLSPRDGSVERFTEHPMQSTVSAFGAGPYAHERDGCATCHGSKHGHAYAGAHDRGMLESALDVGWCADDGGLVVTVRNAAAGHPVPTGDIHRHMYLRVWKSSAPEALFQAYFGRRFEAAPDGGKRTVWDSTIAPGETKRYEVPTAALAGDDDEPINLELVFVFIESEFPRPRHAPNEPTTASVVRKRMAASELPRCAAR
ncbi:MAG TPA: multiheme c-type cytochrome [Kofleriaceae bacterium]|nr:multiheme c-type cytochrome [Kofleriaceae bacterium]